MHFHDLRHSYASILHDKCYSLKKIQEWLRHSDIETTENIYIHILDKSLKTTPLTKFFLYEIKRH